MTLSGPQGAKGLLQSPGIAQLSVPIEDEAQPLERKGQEPDLRDVTSEFIASHKRTIEIYEGILSALLKGSGSLTAGDRAISRARAFSGF
jgi:hypothetical protein